MVVVPSKADAFPKKAAQCRPMRIEVCGSMDDPLVSYISSRLRRYRVRYNAILRIIITLFASSVAEDVLFSENHPLVAAPVCAVCANDSIPVVRRLSEPGSDPVAQFEKFMTYFFLPQAITHNFFRGNLQVPFSASDVSSLVIRHYINEASRTCSFLLADLSTQAAAIIDPHINVCVYEADILRFSLDVKLIICTHCFVDVVSGVSELRETFPTAEVVSGFPLREAGTTLERSLSSLVSFSFVSLPSFSPESMIVELKLHGMIVSLFTGSAISTDSLSRADLFASFPFSSIQASSECGGKSFDYTNISERIAFKGALKSMQLFRDRYIKDLSPLLRDRVVIFPSHGGYNHATYQLDLQWSCFVGDMVRAQHWRSVLAAIESFEDYMTYIATLPTLPSPELFHYVRASNVTAITSSRGCVVVPPKEPMRAAPPLVVDVRDASKYHRLHLRCSLLIPMSFPAEEFGAKRAELWLQCLLLPQQPVAVLCENYQHKEEIKRRLRAISPHVFIQVYVLDDLLSSCPPFGAERCTSVLYGAPHFFSAANLSYREADPSSSHHFSSFQQLDWVQYREPLYRLNGVRKLAAVEPDREGGVVVDVRTPFEFRNGSHQTSIHFSLSDLCQIVASENAALLDCKISPSFTAAGELLNALQEKASIGRCRFSATKIKEIILYCAAGYRSLIAASCFRRAFEAVPDDSDQSLLNTVGVYDVPGGALQLMTQRPDLWQVKDRSIICIS